MQEDGDASEVDGILSFIPNLTGQNSLLGGVTNTLFGSGSSSASAPTRFRPTGPSRFGNRPPRHPAHRPFRRQQHFRPSPPQNCGLFCFGRRKRREVEQQKEPVKEREQLVKRKKRQIERNVLKYACYDINLIYSHNQKSKVGWHV